MGKPPRSLRQTASDSLGQREVLEHITELLKGTDFKKVSITPPARDGGMDVLAVREEFGAIRRYAIEVKAWKSLISADTVRSLMGYLAEDPSLTEFWLVGNKFSNSAHQAAEKSPRVRLFTFEDFERAMKPRRQRRRTARTPVGKAVLINHAQITTTSAALLLLIEERLVGLREERPNSAAAKSTKNQEIAQYESLRGDVATVAAAVTEFKKGTIKEAEVVKATKTFADGVRSWWTKSHQKICDKAFDMGLFLSAVGICSMVGSGGQMAVVVSAALVGGKPIAGVLREVAKKITKD
jgi:hypothetical protein